MAPLLTLFPVLVLLVSPVMSAYDPSICSTMKAPSKTPATSSPVFYDNVYFFTEEKLGPKNFAPYQIQRGIDEYYARGFGRVSTMYYSQDDTLRFLLSPGYHRVLLKSDKVNCNATKIDHNQFYHILHVSSSHKHRGMAYLQESMQWNSSDHEILNYVGKGTLQDRGIPTETWESCTNDSLTHTTLFTQWSFSDPDKVQMPGTTKSILLKKVNEGQDIYYGLHHEYDEETRDYTHWTRNVNPRNDHHFDIPPDMLCGRPRPGYYQRKLPPFPKTFSYTGQKIRTTKTNEVYVDYFKITVMGSRKLTIQDSVEMNPKDTMPPVLYPRLVLDFNTGLQHNMDLTTGSCYITAIDSKNPDSYQLAGKLVSMRTPTQFFDLDTNSYRFLGLYYGHVRSIDSDVFSTKFTDNKTDHKHNTLYTWYIASKMWMYRFNFNYRMPMPVRLDTTAEDNSKQTIEFFEWTSSVDLAVPDVSMCYDSNQEINVEFALNGRYDVYVVPNRKDFFESLRVAIMEQGGLNAYLRVAQLNVQPGNDQTILVQFKLLDTSTIKGDVKHPVLQISSAQVYANLTGHVNSGSFVMELTSRLGSRVIFAVKNSIRTLKPGNIQSPFIAPASGGYSSGAMAGIALGLLIAGLLLGTAVVFGVKKFKGEWHASPISMKALSAEQDN